MPDTPPPSKAAPPRRPPLPARRRDPIPSAPSVRAPRVTRVVCITCRGVTLIDHGFDAETGVDLIVECPDC